MRIGPTHEMCYTCLRRNDGYGPIEHRLDCPEYIREQLLADISKAIYTLDRRAVKIRNMGTCDRCGATTSSGADKLCVDCAMAVLRESQVYIRSAPLPTYSPFREVLEESSLADKIKNALMDE